MKNFWEKLPKPARNASHSEAGGPARNALHSNAGRPFFCIAPMADVTDVAFRQMFAKYGKPDVTWTEFVSADGLVSGGEKILKYDLLYSEKERPIVVQLFSANPEKMRLASKMCALLGFDGIDINMGCPDRAVEKQGAGAALMKDKEKASLLIKAVKDGIKDSGKKNVTVSVKTRIGYNKNELEDWIPFLLGEGLDALTVHARTRKEMSLVPARWEHVKRVVEIRNEMKVKTKIIGNGDVISIEDGIKKCKETGCDGVMVGRGIFGRPDFFAELSGKRPFLEEERSDGKGEALRKKAITKKLKAMLEHAKLFENKLGKVKNFAVMKKHFKAYITGFKGSKELRASLMKTKNYKEVEKILKEYIKRG